MPNRPLRKILFVDDDLDILTIARYALANLKDVEMKFVSSGEEAIREVIPFQPDLILLDVMMPKMDGITTFKIIRELPASAHIPVVFFTAKVQKEEISTYLKAGGIDVITKPFDPIALPALIMKIWEKYLESGKG